MAHQTTPRASAGTKQNPFRTEGPYGHLSPSPLVPSPDFDTLEEALAVCINGRFVYFEVVAAGQNAAGTGRAVRLHAWTTESEGRVVSRAWQRGDVRVSVTSKEKWPQEVVGEIMSVAQGNLGCTVIMAYFKKEDLDFDDDEWVKDFLDEEYLLYKEAEIRDWVEL
ncbi:hypothetical protein CORC01_05606 [Colletotrichum orchidophilum]|uniref:Uncharacterized protein n=1 Tax=Colletotrichum orchidophilum TaxID=1209926 RepID=A0A1G4BCJ7_9PEZI|nr:uncharacterized protein CORC01_05606 [Colletotrichum orchidophilum]OHE99113.1 hypothetical protein CORC01_05606 [Colletotrichum orchidophilum]